MRVHQRTLKEQIRLGRRCRCLMKEEGMTHTILAKRYSMASSKSIQIWIARADEADRKRRRK